MNDQKKLEFFENNLYKIWGDKTNILASFIGECLDENQLKEAFQSWPREIKLKIVERYLKEG